MGLREIEELVAVKEEKSEAIEGYEKRWGLRAYQELFWDTLAIVLSLLMHFFHTMQTHSAWSDYERNIATEGEKTSAAHIIYSLSIKFELSIIF